MSPLPVQNLTTASSDEAIQEAISQSIAQCMGEPVPSGMTESERQAQCSAIAHQYARERTGKQLQPRQQGRK